MPSHLIEKMLAHLDRVKVVGHGWSARCPGHADLQNSLSVNEGQDGRVLLKCFAGCDINQILREAGLTMSDLFSDKRKRDEYPSLQHDNRATVDGCTLAQYSAAKQLPIEFLRTLGLSDCQYQGRPAVRLSYRNEQGAEIAVRYRIALAKSEQGDQRFRWKQGTRPCLYGLWRVEQMRAAGSVVLVEGESDVQTLWLHGIRALGIPGAALWKEEWAKYFEGFETIFVVVEPDAGGKTIRKWLKRSALRDRVRLMEFRTEFKDPSSLFLATHERFLDQWTLLQANAVSLQEAERQNANVERDTAWALCQTLAHQARILDAVADTLSKQKVAGEERAAKLLYLVLTTRLLDEPVSAIVKGPSSAGKSFLVERVLEFFPADAYYALSAMSERALAYSQEPLAHRVLVLYEAAALNSELGAYLVRSLLSEGCVRYETVEKTKNGMEPKLIVCEGPTSLLVTTTAIKLHPENETRMLSIVVSDTPEQTHQILLAQADQRPKAIDLTHWQALQTWIANSELRVEIPYARTLAGLIPPTTIRLRRDFKALLNLIRAHAVLHQSTRVKTSEGVLIATIEDYAVVRELIADLVADGADASVSPQIRETIEAVRLLQRGESTEVSQATVASYLKLDKSATSRRVRAGIERGFLKNLEDRKGRPARLQLGEPMPTDVELLPSSEALKDHCCTVALSMERTHSPLISGQGYAGENTLEPLTSDLPAQTSGVDSTGWPIAIPELGSREHGGYERCHLCEEGTWQRYGGLPHCKQHAHAACTNMGGSKTAAVNSDRRKAPEYEATHEKGENHHG
jgi:hypothetical protein